MESFFEKYKVTSTLVNTIIDKETFINEYGNNNFLYNVIVNYGGNIYNNGLLKIHTFDYVKKWTSLLAEYFKEEVKPFNMCCFASNWQGNMCCIDKNNKRISYFDPATCEIFSADISIEQFFNKTLTDGEYDIIFEEYFNEAYKYMKIKTLNYENSVGHKQYLHLGGEDDVSNFEITNTEVLWELQMQVCEKINKIGDNDG
ncbi:MAG: hypothetical protein LBU76_00100 [Azoarcus sp.]|jgi:hypothetical protein|nr:hypothetical protein [Azoarcus sp.]